MRPAGWCQPKGRIGAAPGATEPMGERGKCLYTLKNTSKSRRSAQNTKKSISNSNNEPNFTLHEISGLGENHLSGFQMMQQDCHIVPQDEPGGSLAITIQDVTSHVIGRRRINNLHVDLKETSDAALESAKEKSEILAMMSHEIRTPMNAVIGFTDILLESSLDPLQLDYVKIIQQSAARLLRLLSDILDFSKLEANRIELHTPFIDLRGCIAEVSRLAEKMASDKGLTYSWKAASPLPLKVKADTGRLTQVLLNLLSNSIKFTENGTAQLIVKSKKLGADSVELLFSISDTGQRYRPRHTGKSKKSAFQALQPSRFKDLGTPRRHRPGSGHFKKTGRVDGR